MNKKGQVLVLFIIILPLMIMMFAIIVDMGVVMNAHNHLESVTRMAIKNVFDKNEKRQNIEKLMVQNDVLTNNLEVNILDNEINIKNKIEVDSIFGKIIGIDKYDIKVDLTGYKENGKILIE